MRKSFEITDWKIRPEKEGRKKTKKRLLGFKSDRRNERSTLTNKEATTEGRRGGKSKK